MLLLAGLILTQLLSSYILLRDRGEVIHDAIQNNLITRTTGIIYLLESLSASERARLLPLLSTPEFRVSLAQQPDYTSVQDEESRKASSLVKRQLVNALPENTEIRVSVEGSIMATERQPMRHRHMMQYQAMHGRWTLPPTPHAMASYFNIQIKLKDGAWAIFEHGVSAQVFNWPIKLLTVLGILLVSVIVLTLVGVLSITKPLRELKEAAEGLGKDIQQSPMKESGPDEVKNTAIAFNTMQKRLKSYIEDRSSILAAVSHDLKTPLTRLRLRADLIDDDELRSKTQTDLDDMETMVTATLDFMRGYDTRENSQQIDLLALLESIQEDAKEAGGVINLQANDIAAYNGKPLALKRCLANLVENAVRYGGGIADIEMKEANEQIIISVCDKGPGIPEDSLKKVFDPFFRLEGSRAKHTGGTGLGLGIARNIARAHGGELVLLNKPHNGLCATLTLPK